MTAPTFISAGTASSSTGDATPGLPGGWAQHDILLLVVETANETVAAPSGWTAVGGSPQGTGTAGGASSTAMHVFWRRATASESAPTVTDAGDHTIAQIFAIRGCVRVGDPWNASGGNVEASSIDPGTITGITSTVNDSMIVFFAAFHIHIPSFDSLTFTNVNVASITNRTAGTYNVGNGGGLGVATGEKASAGATGNTTVSWTGASGGIPGFHAFVVLAMTPAAQLDLAPGAYTISGTAANLEYNPARLTQVLTKTTATDYDATVRDTQVLTKTSATGYNPNVRETQALSKAMAADYGATNLVRDTQVLTKTSATDYGATNVVRDTQVLVKTFGSTINAYTLTCDPGSYAISGTEVSLEAFQPLSISLDSGTFQSTGKSARFFVTRSAGNRVPFCTCCIGGCCNNRVGFPECITLELNVDCCSDIPSTITLCQNGGPSIPEFTDIRWTGETDNPWCLFDGVNHLNGTNVGIGCLTDALTGEEGWYIIIKDTDPGHIWSPSQVWRLTLISCNPLLWEFGGPPECSENPCVIEWQLACFSGETQITTQRGATQIQDIKVGDSVLDRSGESVTVMDIRSASSPAVWIMQDETGQNTIVTPEHPFLRGDDWVCADQISEGDVLSGKTIVRKAFVQKQWLVWNLTVSGSRSFIANGFVVHNK